MIYILILILSISSIDRVDNINKLTKSAEKSLIKNAIIKDINLQHMLIETDSPYLAPIPYRGKTNQPAYVLEVAKKIAEIKKIELDQVIQQTTNNAYSLFNKLKN